MNIFNIEQNIVRPTPHALLIPEFKFIWDRDTSEHKNKAIAEFSFIEFSLSQLKSNPFIGYDEDERADKIKKALKINSLWTPDEAVLEAMKVYEHLQEDASRSVRYYKSIQTALDKLILFYNNTLDFDTSTTSGAKVHKPKDVTDAISKAAANLEQLQKLEDQVNKELYESIRTRANRDISRYEEPRNIVATQRTTRYE
jgi:hypothetical protein